MRARTMVAITAALLAASAVAGCAGSSSSAGSAGGGGERHNGVAAHAVADSSKTLAQAGGLSTSGSALGASNGGVQDANATISNEPLPTTRSTIIKTGRLSIRVAAKAFGNLVPDADQIATDHGGYVVSSGTSGTRHHSAIIVIRVPAAQFKNTMNALRGLGDGKVLSDQRTGEDVGQQFVDLGARARNLKAQSRALIRLMNRAVSVSDTIRVQNELFQVQGQIEELQGRLRYLHDQADMSTITLDFSQSGTTAHHHHSHPSAIGGAFRRGWNHAVSVVTAVIVGAGLVIPVALLVALALLAGYWLRPLVLRRLHAPDEAPAAE
jgi:hypothetical protein